MGSKKRTAATERARVKASGGSEPAAPAEGPEAAAPRADPRPWIYLGVDLAFAALYLVVAYRLLPASGASFRGASLVVALAALAAGAGTASRRRAGWWAAIAGCAVVLVAGLALIVLLVLASAYLKGIYGAVGRGASMGALVAAALAIEVYCLWPLFQLRYLLSAAGRRAVARGGR